MGRQWTTGRRRVLLTSFAHNAHLRFADAVDADTMHFRETYDGPGNETPLGDIIAGQHWPEADTYLIEGSAPLYAATIRGITESTPIIYLGYDRGLIHLFGNTDTEDNQPIADRFIKRYGLSTAKRVARAGIDGAIVASSLVGKYAKELFGDIPIEVVPPMDSPSLYSVLANVEPSLDSNHVTTVGRAMAYKGTKHLVNGWRQVRKVNDGATLSIAGLGEHPEWFDSEPGVSIKGFVPHLPAFFGRHSLAVQPSRGDAWALTAIEAMQAGVPCLVTETTGTKDAVQRVSDNLVTGEDSTDLAAGVNWYFNLSIDERQELSRRAQDVAADYNPKNLRQEFVDAVNRIESTV